MYKSLLENKIIDHIILLIIKIDTFFYLQSSFLHNWLKQPCDMNAFVMNQTWCWPSSRFTYPKAINCVSYAHLNIQVQKGTWCATCNCGLSCNDSFWFCLFPFHATNLCDQKESDWVRIFFWSDERFYKKKKHAFLYPMIRF